MSLLIVSGMFYCCIVVGQNEDFFRLSWENLPQGYSQKKQRVENLLSKSTFYFQKAGKAENEVLNYQESGNSNPMRELALQERVYRLYLKAYSFVENAHRIQYNLLDDLLDDIGLSGFEKKRIQMEKQFWSSSVLRRKGEGVVPRMNPKSLLAEATEQEFDVLKGMEKLLSGENVAMDSPVKQKDSALLAIGMGAVEEGVGSEVDTMRLVPQNSVKELFESTVPARGGIKESEENMPSVKPAQNNAVELPETDVFTEKTKEVFYSIQFMATREQVSDKQVEKIYDGALPVIENRSDGWYRFSAGKFDTVGNAMSEMKKEGIHGFIVAFKGDERISISKAKSLK